MQIPGQELVEPTAWRISRRENALNLCSGARSVNDEISFGRPDTAKKNGPVGRVRRVRRSGSHSIYEINRQGYEARGSLNDISLAKTPTSPACGTCFGVTFTLRAELCRPIEARVVRWSEACSTFGRFTGPTPGPLPENPSDQTPRHAGRLTSERRRRYRSPRGSAAAPRRRGGRTAQRGSVKGRSGFHPSRRR
jgi:hypothetical protein